MDQSHQTVERPESMSDSLPDQVPVWMQSPDQNCCPRWSSNGCMMLIGTLLKWKSPSFSRSKQIHAIAMGLSSFMSPSQRELDSLLELWLNLIDFSPKKLIYPIKFQVAMCANRLLYYLKIWHWCNLTITKLMIHMAHLYIKPYISDEILILIYTFWVAQRFHSIFSSPSSFTVNSSWKIEGSRSLQLLALFPVQSESLHVTNDFKISTRKSKKIGHPWMPM